MIKRNLELLFGIIITVLLSGCGGESEPIVVYRFKATVQSVTPAPESPATTGDVVIGTFSFVKTTEDLNNNSDQGVYRPPTPAKVSFILNKFSFESDNSDPKYYPAYNVLIEDNYSQTPRDLFEWTAAEKVIVNQSLTNIISVNFALIDSTSKAFSDDTLPLNFNIQNFDKRSMRIMSFVMGTGAVNWDMSLQIDEVTRL